MPINKETPRQRRRRMKKERQRLARANNTSVRQIKREVKVDGLVALERLYDKGQLKATNENVSTFLGRRNKEREASRAR